MRKAEALLAWACHKMDERYEFLRRAEVRNIQGYNQLARPRCSSGMRPEDDDEQKRIPTYMPYIVIVADEMADLMMTAAKVEVEQYIVRLAQLSVRGGDAPDPRDSEARCRCGHRLDQGKHAGPDLVQGRQPW